MRAEILLTVVPEAPLLQTVEVVGVLWRQFPPSRKGADISPQPTSYLPSGHRVFAGVARGAPIDWLSHGHMLLADNAEVASYLVGHRTWKCAYLRGVCQR